MSNGELVTNIDTRGVADIVLNRPKSHNSLSPGLVTSLLDVLARFREDPNVRVAVIRGAGRSFCAGGDISALESMSTATYEDNIGDAELFTSLFQALWNFPKPLIAQVHGYALAGGTAIVACVDIAVSADDTVFGITETRIGLVPAVIAPYVVGKIGASAARRYLLTGERFDASDAYRMGLVHELCEGRDPSDVTEVVVGELLAAAPAAQRRIKAIASQLAQPRPELDLRSFIEESARARMSTEAHAGMKAFLSRQAPPWSGPIDST